MDLDTQSLTLDVQQLGDKLIVTLPGAVCFYESRAAGIVEALGHIAENQHRRENNAKVRGVLLLQNAHADDRQCLGIAPPAAPIGAASMAAAGGKGATPNFWLAELKSTCMFADLARRIDTWRWLLSLIRNAPVPWVYAASGHCLGSAFELALSCQRRYFFASEVTVGFPEISCGAFPPGGVLDSLSKRIGSTRERWQARPVISATEAAAEGLLDFCSAAAEWQIPAKAMFHELLKVNPLSGVRHQRSRRARVDFGLIDQESRATAIEQMETVGRLERGGAQPDAWAYCWHLLKERAKLKKPEDLGRMICCIAARFFLAPTYITWLEASAVSSAATLPLLMGSLARPRVLIDLDGLAPPTAILVRLLRAPLRLAFVASGGLELSAALNMLFNRLERALGASEAQRLWEARVTWHQAPTPQQTLGQDSLLLRWPIDDRFEIVSATGTSEFLRLEGTATDVQPGVLEWLASPPPSSTLGSSLGNGGNAAKLSALENAVLPLVSDGVIRTHRVSVKSLPMTAYVRSRFFQEMLRVSAYVDGDLVQVTEGLKTSGWRFAGNDEAWDRFLRARRDSYPFDADVIRPGTASHLRADAEVGNWKHARALAKKLAETAAAKAHAAAVPPTTAKVSDTARWNATAISQHMALFLGLLAREVAGTTLELKAEQTLPAAVPKSGPYLLPADYLCAVALGLPLTYGTPLGFLRRWGRSRVQYYAARHWGARSGEPAAGSIHDYSHD